MFLDYLRWANCFRNTGPEFKQLKSILLGYLKICFLKSQAIVLTRHNLNWINKFSLNLELNRSREWLHYFLSYWRDFFLRQIINFSESWQVICRDETPRHYSAHLSAGFRISIIKAPSLASISKGGQQLPLIISSTPECFLLKCVFWYFGYL